MKRNNKALYEQIMRNVSKQVKRALNENNSNYLGFFDFIPELMVFMERDNDRVDEEETGASIIYYFTKNYLSNYLNIDDEVLGKQFKNAIQSGIDAINEMDEDDDDEYDNEYDDEDDEDVWDEDDDYED